MTDGTVAEPPKPIEAKIDQFITGYAKQATLTNGVVILAHSGDAVTLTLATPFTRATFRHRQTERVNTTTKTPLGSTDAKKDITHEDNLYTLDAANPSKTVVNDNEKTVESAPSTGITVSTFYDFNHFVTLEEAYYIPTKEDGTPGTETKAGVTVVTPPASPDNADKPFEIPWLWIAVAVIAVAAIGLVIYAYSRRPAVAPVAAAPAPAGAVML